VSRRGIDACLNFGDRTLLRLRITIENDEQTGVHSGALLRHGSAQARVVAPIKETA